MLGEMKAQRLSGFLRSLERIDDEHNRTIKYAPTIDEHASDARDFSRARIADECLT